MRVKNDHRSKFSNLSNWKEEAWKKSGLQQGFEPVTSALTLTSALHRFTDAKKKTSKKNGGGIYVSKIENLPLKSVSQLIPFPWNQKHEMYKKSTTPLVHFLRDKTLTFLAFTRFLVRSVQLNNKKLQIFLNQSLHEARFVPD